jgi:hypothetical protein
MDRYEHCTIEWYWATPPGADPATFAPTFTLFFAGGQSESHQGGRAELTSFFSKLGHSGWRITTAVNSSNWILWTLERKLACPVPPLSLTEPGYAGAPNGAIRLGWTIPSNATI